MRLLLTKLAQEDKLLGQTTTFTSVLVLILAGGEVLGVYGRSGADRRFVLSLLV